MDNKDFLKAVIASVGEPSITAVAAKKILYAASAVAAQRLKEVGKVEVPGFGIYTVVATKERTARNPKTGEPVNVPAGRKLKVKAQKSLRDAVAA